MATRSRSDSARVNRVWKRLGEWYGARFGDVYGDEPSPDWRAVVDAAENSEVVAALALIRQRHVTFPPTLPEFESLFREVRRRKNTGADHEPTIAERLGDYALQTRRLTFNQLRGWVFLYRLSAEGEYITTALVIPSDGEHAGHRVTAEDMQAHLVYDDEMAAG